MGWWSGNKGRKKFYITHRYVNPEGFLSSCRDEVILARIKILKGRGKRFGQGKF